MERSRSSKIIRALDPTTQRTRSPLAQVEENRLRSLGSIWYVIGIADKRRRTKRHRTQSCGKRMGRPASTSTAKNAIRVIQTKQPKEPKDENRR